jgi:hypothetical protein
MQWGTDEDQKMADGGFNRNWDNVGRVARLGELFCTAGLANFKESLD